MATYRYLEDIFGADVLIHVGTHGNLEFLPGKGVGLSRNCYPDICIGTIPHLYIYNADNPPEGTIAKRRSYATLVDHMQTVMTQSGLYDELLEVDRLLGEYETAKHDHARSHELRHLLIDAIKAANLDKGMKLTDDMPVEEIVTKAHNELSPGKKHADRFRHAHIRPASRRRKARGVHQLRNAVRGQRRSPARARWPP